MQVGYYLFGHGGHLCRFSLWIHPSNNHYLRYYYRFIEEQTGLLEVKQIAQSNSGSTPERMLITLNKLAAWQELADVVKEANVTEQMDPEFQHLIKYSLHLMTR